MKTIKEILELIDYIEQNACIRPQMFVSVPVSIEDLLLNLNTLKYNIINEEGLFEKESYRTFLIEQGYGPESFIGKKMQNQSIQLGDWKIPKDFCLFWEKYLKWRSNLKNTT
ncbi:hypothetical protein [Gimesia chilikensis]|uniref:hypothetical protein n=1 Tax=Gimesia chilikensis TaxID=2605989 RepID=UPI003A8E64A9